MDEKPKRKRSPPPEKPPYRELRGGDHFWPEISLSTERLIGRISVEWAKLEASMHDLIWTLTGLSIEDGRALTEKQDAVRLIDLLYRLSARHIPELTFPGEEDKPSLRHRFQDTLDVIEHHRRDRNFILHGSWAKFNGIPMAASLREKDKNARADEVVSETFPPERLRAIAHNISQCKIVIERTRDILIALREKRPPPPPEDLDIHPSDP